MCISSEEKRSAVQKRLSPRRAATTFVLLGSCLVVSTFVSLGLWDVLWTDVIRSNPHRSITHALFALPLVSAVAGVFMVIFHYSGALMLAGAVAALVARGFGRVPFWSLIILATLCAPAIFIQDAALPDFHLYAETPEQSASSISTYDRNIRLNAYFLPALLGSWLALLRKFSA